MGITQNTRGLFSGQINNIDILKLERVDTFPSNSRALNICTATCVCNIESNVSRIP